MNMVSAAFARSYHTPGDELASRAYDFRCGERGESAGPVVALPPGPARGLRPGLGVGHGDRFREIPLRLGNKIRWLTVPLILASLCAASTAALGARERLVAMAPVLAPVYAAIGLPVNVRGLAIENVSARLADIGDKRFLVVEGSVVNLRATDAASPDLRIALRGADGRELYVWTARAAKARLAKGEQARFAARLEAPPDGVKDAIVKFVAAGEKTARGAEGS